MYGYSHTKAHGINSLGQIAGAGKDTVNFSVHAVLWLNKDTPGQDLGFLGKGAYVDYSEAYGINDFGHVVGNSALGTATRGFLWRNGTMINLAALSRTASEGTSASAVNNRGLAVGKSNLYPVTWRFAAAHRRGCDRWRSLLVDESTNAEVPESLIANDELPVRERDARTTLHRTLVSRDDAKRDARRVRKQIRCRVLHAHGKIRRRHLNFPSGW